MIRIGIRELRQNATHYLRMVKAGETVEVTDRGQLVALLVPPSPAKALMDRLVAIGSLRPATTPFIPPARRVSIDGGESASDTLARLREERLA